MAILDLNLEIAIICLNSDVAAEDKVTLIEVSGEAFDD